MLSEIEPMNSEIQALGAWLSDHVDGFVDPVAHVDVASAGRSNVTMILTDSAGTRFVVRKPPPVTALPTAHDVFREGRIMAALYDTAVPVPQIQGMTSDESVIGVPFVVMNHVEGHVIDSIPDADVLNAEERRTVGIDLAVALAALHTVNPGDVGLGDLAKTENFIGRQLSRFHRQWRDLGDDALTKSFMDCHETLVARQPAESDRVCIVHGDYRIGNVIVAEGKVQAVLDWELTTLGHSLADLAYLLNNWVTKDEATNGPITSPIAAGGFGTREDIIATYEQHVSWPVDRGDIAYFRALAYWRLASIRSGVVDRLENHEDPLRREQARQSRQSLPLLIGAAQHLLLGDKS